MTPDLFDGLGPLRTDQSHFKELKSREMREDERLNHVSRERDKCDCVRRGEKVRENGLA